MKSVIKMRALVGDFAENKEIAKKIRIEELMPNLSKGNDLEIDFDGVNGATQSFIHALISDPIRQFGDVALEKLYYRNVDDDIKEVLSIVYHYMQESLN